jgi:hypothetical protein
MSAAKLQRMKIRGLFLATCLLVTVLGSHSALAQAQFRGLQQVDEGLLQAYRKNPEILRGDRDKAFRVCEANLVKYYNDLMLYYMDMYKMETPPVEFSLVLLYLEWMHTLPTPTLVDIAKNSTIHHPLTVAIISKISTFEKATGRKTTVFAPPPFVVNTTLVGPDGVAVPIQTRDQEQATKAVKIVAAETSKMTEENTEKLRIYAVQLKSLEQAQKNSTIMMIALGVLAFVGLITGFLGLRASR